MMNSQLPLILSCIILLIIFSLDAEIKQKSKEISSSQALLNDGPRSSLRKGPQSPLGKSPQATGEPKVYTIARAANDIKNYSGYQL